MTQNTSLLLNKTQLLEFSKAELLLSDQFKGISHFFSSNGVFINSQELHSMQSMIAVTQKIFLHDFFLSHFKISPHESHGLFCAYDFHLTPDGPKLIEINTNAGGALINYYFLESLHLQSAIPYIDFEQIIIRQFKQEWALSTSGKSELKTICILDDKPETQFLYPEFLLFKDLLSKNLANTHIVDASDLTLLNNQLCFNGEKVDFIYNRLTDFYFSQTNHSHLKYAYENNLCVFSPAPSHHAQYANKEIFIELSDVNFLKNFNLSLEELKMMEDLIPKTSLVTLENKDQLWQNRKKLFFKPVTGYGSKGVYRGDKITHKAFDEILKDRYIGQELIPPPIRLIEHERQKQFLKFDIRLYCYAGNAFLAAARLFEGQATNFRTPGGGFAAVKMA